MKIPLKKLKNGFEMPVFGFGTWRIGGNKIRNPDNDDEGDVKAIKTAIEKGMTHIDTAPGYAEGHAEELVGEAIKDFKRSKLFITTKVSPSYLKYKDIFISAKESLKRLKTDYIDLYLIHAPNPEIPIKETMKAFDELKKNGMIKNIGVSNFNIKRFEEAQSVTKNKIVAIQNHYNLIVRESETKGVVNYCQKNDVIFIAWRPIEKGLLNENGNTLMQEMCRKYNKTPIQIALNWLISQPNIVTISKTNNVKHLEENLEALGWEMKKEDIEKLNKNYPNKLDVSPAVPLV